MSTLTGNDLLAIVALARAGAVDLAWAMFLKAGLVEVVDDPKVLTLKGRLLKDRALRSTGNERRAFFKEAASAYRVAASLSPSSYALINSATLAFLAKDEDSARAGAREVLELIASNPREPETPYYLAATRAEALLLLGQTKEARVALLEAVQGVPRAWEDHASTLRQFALILAAQGGDATWLNAYRPPRSLHFGGHMSFHPRVVRRERLDQTIAIVLEEERIGFGYGALAAGADILIAEALTARGAELHVILPGSVDAFASVSVDPFGKSWRRRFDALIEKAETVRTGRLARAAPGPQTIGVADEVAMGAAAMNARRLESEAIQLLVVDGGGALRGRASARARAIWAESHRRQRLLKVPREAMDTLQVPTSTEDPRIRPLAVLAVVTAESVEEGALETELKVLGRAVAEAPHALVGPYWTGGRVLVAHERLQDAAELALSLARRGYRVGGDYVAAAPVADPFSGVARLGPSASGAAEAAAASTPNGSACVTEDFAAALAARGGSSIRSEFVGELDPPDARAPIGLHALK